MTEKTLYIKTGAYAPGGIISNTFSKFVFSALFALLLCLSANSFVYLPFTPVPMTMQVMTVLLSAVMLGRYWAVVAQIQYIALGLAGLPVFAGFKSGAAALSGPTAGYIAGFIGGAFLAGYICDKSRANKLPLFIPAQEGIRGKYQNVIKNITAPVSLFLACLAGLAVIYIAGWLHLAGYLYVLSHSSASIAQILKEAIKIGVAPFVISDMFKIAIILNLYKIKGSHEKN